VNTQHECSRTVRMDSETDLNSMR